MKGSRCRGAARNARHGLPARLESLVRTRLADHAQRAADIDVIYCTGYGFPGYRGGPMWYADTVGLKKIYNRILEFEAKHGELWSPSPLLKRLAETGGTFAEYDSAKK